MTYLHGIEIKEGQRGATLAVGDTSVIAIVGTAPKGVKTPVLVTSLQKARETFGDDVAGFTLPAALETIFSVASPKVIALNVLEASAAAALMENGKMKRDSGGALASHIYESNIPTAVAYTTELIKGIKSLETLESSLGVKPNIIICPGYSHQQTVLEAMIAAATKLNGFAVADIIADSVQAALTARASGAFNRSDASLVLCFPTYKRYNTHENTETVQGLSVQWALCKILREYHISPSNTELTGVMAPTVDISASLTDESADTNLLNGQGITTVFRKSGAGTRLWGNWTAAFPTVNTPEAMVAPRSVRMAIREALVDSALSYLDKTPTKVAIELVTADVNAFLRTLSGKGAIEKGDCLFDEDLNPATEVAMGRLTFTLSVKYASSTELLTFIEEVEI